MKRILHCILWLTCALLLAGCHDKLEAPASPLRCVAVVYMMAENSLSGFAQLDLAEMRSAAGMIPDSCRLVVYIDDSRTGQNPRILLFDDEGRETTLFEYSSDPLSTDSATLQNVLSLVQRKCPARHYGLVLWSHGSGWIPQEESSRRLPRRTIGIDNGKNISSGLASDVGQEMEISTLANVLRRTGVVWDYILFDACFMQSVEVAYELKDVTRWCIGSPAEIPGAGAPYDVIMPDLFLGGEEAWRIAEDYYNYYKDDNGLVISAVRSDQLEALAAVTAPHVPGLPPYPTTDGVQKYYALREPTQWKPEYFDLGSAMHQWLAEDDYAEWLERLLAAVPHRYAAPHWVTAFYYVNATVTDPDHIAALSLYVPTEHSPLNEPFRQTAWAKAVGW